MDMKRLLNNNEHENSSKDHLIDDVFSEPISFIEIQSNRRKRYFIKTIALTIAFVFFLQQTGFSADLYKRKRSDGVLDSLLSSPRDAEQSNAYSPDYLKRQQNKHEEILRQKTAKDDMILNFGRPKRKVEEAVPLKKKKGSGGSGSQTGSGMGEENADYMMNAPDDVESPHELNDFVDIPEITQFDSQTTKYDITKTEINQWMSNAERKIDEETGQVYWIGRGDANVEDDRAIQKIMYTGEGDDRQVSEIYLGFRETDSGEYEAKFRIDYKNGGSNVLETKKYDISGNEDLLVELSVYSGSDDNNRVEKTVYYEADGSVKQRRDYSYGSDGTLEETAAYDTESEEAGEGELTQRTVYDGAKDEEIANYTQKVHNGEVSSTTIHFYCDGHRASEVSGEEYRYAKSKDVTYRGNSLADKDADCVDANGDGIDDKAIKLSETFYDDQHRLAGEEVVDYTFLYNAYGQVISKTVYFYADGRTANEANYRECMTRSSKYTVYYTDEDEDGVKETMNVGDLISSTFFDTAGRLKGEEKADYTVKYNSTGDEAFIIVYWYEGADGTVRASEATSEDAMKKTVTYSDDSIAGEEYNADGTLKDGEDGLVDNPIKVSETFYQGAFGEEKADYTFKYDSLGNVTSLTVYWYEGISGRVKAVDATAFDAMKKTVTYSNDSIAEEEYNEDGTLKDGEDGLMDDPIKISETFYQGSYGEEKADVTYQFRQDGSIKTTTVYYYEHWNDVNGNGSVDEGEITYFARAGDAIPGDALRLSVVYRGDVIAAEEFAADGSILDGEDGIKDGVAPKAKTTYAGNEGEEKAQKTYNYNYDGDVIKTVTTFTYTGNELTLSVTRKVDNVTDILADVVEGVKKSETVYAGNEGEEKAQVTYSYNFDGDDIKTATTFTYVADALTLSVTNRVSNETADRDAVVLGTKKSETVYVGNEGEEKAQTTYNYNFDGDAIKTVTSFTYVDEALALSVTNKVSNETADRDVVVLGAKKSETVYAGNEGEEKAQTTYNYNFDGDAIKTVTSFTYVDDALTLSVTNKVSNETADRDAVVLGVKKSETAYAGNEGEEKAQATYNYNFDGDAIKTVTTFTYTADALTLSVTNSVNASAV